MAVCCVVVTGEMLEMHVQTEPAEREQIIVSKLQKLEEEIEAMTVEERKPINDLLQRLQAKCVGARITDSILLITHLVTPEILKSVRKMFKSGQLTLIVRDLFRCLARDRKLTVGVEIDAESFKKCEDGFTEDGKSVAVHKHGIGQTLVYKQ